MRTYEKSNPEKSPYDPPKIKRSDVKDVSVTPITDTGEHYRKEDGVRVPYSFIVIISGGEVREKNYFRIISDQKRFRQIKIEFIADRAKLNPNGLLETAIYKQEHYKTSQKDEPDKIFILSDVDHFTNDLLKIKPECEKLDIRLIISNSCFEVWLYYSKFATKPTDFPMPTDKLKTSQSFKNYLDTKVKGGINPVKAIFDIAENIENARNNYAEMPNGIPELFSTNMFVLAEELLPLISEELEKVNAESKLKTDFYKIMN
jgi:hypothetical protein